VTLPAGTLSRLDATGTHPFAAAATPLLRAAAALASCFAVAPMLSSSAPTPSSSGLRGIVVNYSPTVVINAGSERTDLNRIVMETLERHGHELAAILHREFTKRERSAF